MNWPASVDTALRSVSCGVASSVKCVWRAHISLASRSPASETVIAIVNSSGTDTAASVTYGRFGYIRLRVHGCASGPSRFVFRQVRWGSVHISIHRHLTIRSSRPHVVTSAMCFALRLHTSAAPPRGGLTQALGGRKAFICFAFPHGELAGFGWRYSSFGFLQRWFFGQVRVTRSHITCVAFAGFGNDDWHGQYFAADTVTSDTSGWKFAGARPGLPTSIFGSCAEVSLLSASPAT